MTKRVVMIVALATVLLGAACGGSGPHSAASGIAHDRASAPATLTALLDPFRLQIQRWSIDPLDAHHPQYELSIYSRPASTQTADQYAGRFAPLAAAVIPAVFAKYPDIAWVDLCQELAHTPSNDWEPEPVTRIEITRKAAAAIDWSHVTTADLLARNMADSDNVQVETHSGVAQTALWKAAAARIRAHTKGG